ncbi:SET domain-containing protein [Peribacillus acanthi]|uniref:SET domain-containing protein n=1 Tax=Peribacillus acanthi TaxID=2171554 RepID=UPI000D3EB5EF|nr:SET domain-containing protein [Peribacillus acanthi]
MIHPHTELRYINDKIGFGVFATEFIPKGTIVWALDELDQILEPEYIEGLNHYNRDVLKKYSYRNQEGKYILCWDLGRFVNHSFHANCLGTAYEFEVAIRDIFPGEQLTDDYGSLNIDYPFEAMPEEGTERRIVYPDDLLYYSEEWDRKVISALKHFNEVEQPLLHLIQPQFIEKVQIAAKEQILLDSIKSIYFHRRNYKK